MKALNIIICLLAVTLFVACSKKKDGNSNPYNNNPYGLAPNDIRSGYNNGYINNGIPNQGVLPGYQLPQGCGTGQMFSDALSYCGWLATEGERACNPLVVKQMFLQYCQSFAVQYNYCVPQVQSGCYYGSGCSFGSKTIRYHDRKRPRDDVDYGGSGDQDSGLPVQVTPAPKHTEPVYVQPAPKCYGDKDKDCKEKYSKNSKKASQLICKHPNESASEANYLYTYEEYLDIVASECNAKSTVATSVQTAPVYSETTTTTTTVPAQKVYGKLGVEYGPTPSTKVYGKLGVVYSDTDPRAQTTQVQTTTTTPQKAKTVYIMQDDLAKTMTSKTIKATPSVSSCLNLQKMHEAIISPENHLSSIRIFIEGDLLNKSTDSKAFNTKFVETIKSDKSVYYGNVEGMSSNNLSGIGYNVKQTASTLRVYTGNKQSGMANAVGTIQSCGEKILVAQFKTPYGSERVTYTWNGLMDDDFEMIINRNGTFKSGSSEDSYMMSSYVGLAKDMKDLVKKDDQIIHKKVQADMHDKGLFEEAYKK